MGGRVTAVQSLSGGLQADCRWALCCTARCTSLRSRKNVGRGCGTMLVVDAKPADTRGPILGERPEFVAIVAGF